MPAMPYTTRTIETPSIFASRQGLMDRHVYLSIPQDQLRLVGGVRRPDGRCETLLRIEDALTGAIIRDRTAAKRHALTRG